MLSLHFLGFSGVTAESGLFSLFSVPVELRGSSVEVGLQVADGFRSGVGNNLRMRVCFSWKRTSQTFIESGSHTRRIDGNNEMEVGIGHVAKFKRTARLARNRVRSVQHRSG